MSIVAKAIKTCGSHINASIINETISVDNTYDKNFSENHDD